MVSEPLAKAFDRHEELFKTLFNCLLLSQTALHQTLAVHGAVNNVVKTRGQVKLDVFKSAASNGLAVLRALAGMPNEPVHLATCMGFESKNGRRSICVFNTHACAWKEGMGKVRSSGSYTF